MEAGLKTVRSGWSNTVLVCRKCSKKLGGGFGPRGRTTLAKALRQELGVKKGRKGALGIVEVKCLGVCPRGAVTVVNGAKPGEWVLVQGGAAIEEIVDAFGLQTCADPAAKLRKVTKMPKSCDNLRKSPRAGQPRNRAPQSVA